MERSESADFTSIFSADGHNTNFDGGPGTPYYRRDLNLPRSSGPSDNAGNFTSERLLPPRDEASEEFYGMSSPSDWVPERSLPRTYSPRPILPPSAPRLEDDNAMFTLQYPIPTAPGPRVRFSGDDLAPQLPPQDAFLHESSADGTALRADFGNTPPPRPNTPSFQPGQPSKNHSCSILSVG